MKDRLVRATDQEGKIRVLVATATSMVEEARKIHNTSPTATAALGRGLVAGTLMGSMMKNEEDILTLKIDGNGPGGEILIVARNNGEVKGEIMHPEVDLPSKGNGKLDVGGLVGNDGNITIIMDLGLKEPYIGVSKLISGEIAEDLANYYAYSEQKPTVVSLGVLVDKDISVKAAGGYIIQLLPGSTEEDIVTVEEALDKIKPVSELVDQGLEAEEIMDTIFEDLEMKILASEDIAYKCDCSKEKIRDVLKNLGKTELESMIQEDQGAEVVCHFCNTKHIFDKKELEEIMIDI